MRRIELILLFALAGCTTTNPSKFTEASAFDSVMLATDATNVEQLVGKPHEIQKAASVPGSEFWIYNSPGSSGGQIASVEITIANRTVKSVTVVPRAGTSDANFASLIASKFSKNSFEKVALLRCQRDYVPSEVYYIDKTIGVSIEVNRYGDDVESYSRMSSQEAQQFLADVKSCKR